LFASETRGECESTLASNYAIVQRFKAVIREFLPELIDSVDSLDYGILSSIRHVFIQPTPTNVHNRFHYQTAKIFDYLTRVNDDFYPRIRTQFVEFYKGLNHQDDDDFYNETWGLVQACEFYEEFAKKHITLKPLDMSFDEIRMLVSAACYFEKIEQESK